MFNDHFVMGQVARVLLNEVMEPPVTKLVPNRLSISVIHSTSLHVRPRSSLFDEFIHPSAYGFPKLAAFSLPQLWRWCGVVLKNGCLKSGAV